MKSQINKMKFNEKERETRAVHIQAGKPKGCSPLAQIRSLTFLWLTYEYIIVLGLECLTKIIF